jgi:hypothetical protein
MAASSSFNSGKKYCCAASDIIVFCLKLLSPCPGSISFSDAPLLASQVPLVNHLPIRSDFKGLAGELEFASYRSFEHVDLNLPLTAAVWLDFLMLLRCSSDVVVVAMTLIRWQLDLLLVSRRRSLLLFDE